MVPILPQVLHDSEFKYLDDLVWIYLDCPDSFDFPDEQFVEQSEIVFSEDIRQLHAVNIINNLIHIYDLSELDNSEVARAGWDQVYEGKVESPLGRLRERLLQALLFEFDEE